MSNIGQATSTAAAVLYGTLSLSMAFVNKAVLSQYKFNFPFFILACQMALSVVVLEALRVSGRISVPGLSVAAVRSFLVPALCYALHATLSLVALEGMNIPMYAALKRCTPLVTLVLAVYYLKKPAPSPALAASVAVITLGCLLAGLADPTFDGFAYVMGGLSVVAQAVYLTLVQQCGENKVSPLHVLHLNSCISVLPFLALTFVLGEVTKITQFEYLGDVQFLAVLATVLVFGLALNFSLFLCTMINSALTTSIVGVIKSVFQTLIGFVAFGGVALNAINVLGLAMNTAGGFLYTYGKYQEESRRRVKVDLGDSGIQQKGWELKQRLEAKM